MLDTKTCWTRENGYSTLVMHLDHAFKGELCDVNNISPLCLRLSLRTTLTWVVGITIDFVLRAFTHHSLKRCQLGKRDNDLIHVWRGYFGTSAATESNMPEGESTRKQTAPWTSAPRSSGTVQAPSVSILSTRASTRANRQA